MYQPQLMAVAPLNGSYLEVDESYKQNAFNESATVCIMRARRSKCARLDPHLSKDHEFGCS